MKKIMCFGTFDLLHPGHLNYLQQAKKYGDYLIVVLARDKTKSKLNKKTLFQEKERLKLIQHLDLVDKAVLGDLNDHFKIIHKHQPDTLCLGYDHKIKIDNLINQLAKQGLYPKIKRMKPHKKHKYKSSKLKQIPCKN